MIITHPDEDHLGGAPALLRDFKVGRLFINGDTKNTREYAEFQKAVNDHAIQPQQVEKGDTTEAAGISFKVLSPGKSDWTINDRSLVLWAEVNGRTVLLAADILVKAQTDLLESGLPIKADILKLPHHGDETTEAFIRAVSPEIAVYSVSKDNDLGFAVPATIENLDKIGARVVGTDMAGNIILTLSPQGLELQTQKGLP